MEYCVLFTTKSYFCFPKNIFFPSALRSYNQRREWNMKKNNNQFGSFIFPEKLKLQFSQQLFTVLRNKSLVSKYSEKNSLWKPCKFCKYILKLNSVKPVWILSCPENPSVKIITPLTSVPILSELCQSDRRQACSLGVFMTLWKSRFFFQEQ